MADLFEWLGSTKLHPLLASCVFHYEFEFIHPFSDGNGRIGRLWHTLLLARWRSVLAWLPIESMIRERQDAYYAALNESNATGSSTAFVAFMLSAIRDAMEPFCTEERREDGLRNSILSLMAENPSITVSEIAEAVGLARRTTERAMLRSRKAGASARRKPTRRTLGYFLKEGRASPCPKGEARPGFHATRDPSSPARPSRT